MSNEVINLKEEFGSRYRVIREESGGRSSRDPWYWIIPGKYGEIYPHGGKLLAVMVTSIIVANRMRRWPELEVHEDGEDGVVFIFDIEHFEKVAKRIEARKQRSLSPDHREKVKKAGTTALEKYRNPTLRGKPESQNPRSRPEATPGMAQGKIVDSGSLFCLSDIKDTATD